MLQALLEQLWKFYFDFTRDFVAVDSGAVTHCEEMEALLTAHVGRQCVRVLVDFVGIAGLVTTRRSKRKLCNGIESFSVHRLKLLLATLTIVIISIVL